MLAFSPTMLMFHGSQIPVLGFAAFSGTGKTTLLRQLIPLLRDSGLRLGLIKHSHHAFEVDRPGKDSYVLRQAGAAQMLVASRRRIVLMTEYPEDDVEPDLCDFLNDLPHESLDIILIEGFKYYPIPKIELYRPSLGHPLICQQDPAVIAVATDAPLPIESWLTILDLNDPPSIARFIRKRFLTDRSLQRGE